MKRDLDELTRYEYDVLVVGGGAFGAAVAWDAALRGLSVALVEREDFGAGVSANSFKMIHGGIRYLQHADVARVRASCRERSALLRIAPHLVHPLPIAVPTYGHGRMGKGFLGAGMLLYDLITLDRNRGIGASRQVPMTRFLDRNQALGLFPDLDGEGLTGATVFHDGQMYNPPRLVLAFIQSAVDAGARVANYVEATGFVRDGDRILGVKARDVLSDASFELRARMVVNAAGPWAERLLREDRAVAPPSPGIYSRDACFVVPRRFEHPYALAVTGRTRDPDAVLARPARHLFLVPWREHTLVGVWHVVYRKDPDGVTVSDNDLDQFIDEINWAYPELAISRDEVSMWNAGLVPFGENRDDAVDLSYGKRSRLIDHARTHGVRGLVTLIGIRYTMARGDAAEAMSCVAKQLGKGVAAPPTDRIPLHGGDIGDYRTFADQHLQTLPFPDDVSRALLRNYGANHGTVARLAAQEPVLAEALPGSTVLRAEVIHAVREEMAVNLSDIVFRRTDLATGGHPGVIALHTCAHLAATELGWDERRTGEEIRRVVSRFPAASADGGLVASAV